MRPRILRHCRVCFGFFAATFKGLWSNLLRRRQNNSRFAILSEAKKKGNLRPETSNLVIWQAKCYPRPGLQRGPVVETCPAGAHLRLGQTGSAKCMAKPTVVAAAVRLVMFLFEIAILATLPQLSKCSSWREFFLLFTFETNN